MENVSLSSKKATGIENIPAKVLKAYSHAYLKDLTIPIKDYLEKYVFQVEISLN